MKRFCLSFVCVLGIAASSTAHAEDCSGAVQSVTVAPEGDLYVDFGYSRVKICQFDANLTVDRGSSHGGTTTITAARCEALYGAFLTARASGNPVTARRDGDCSFVDGAYPNPYPFQFIF